MNIISYISTRSVQKVSGLARFLKKYETYTNNLLIPFKVFLLRVYTLTSALLTLLEPFFVVFFCNGYKLLRRILLYFFHSLPLGRLEFSFWVIFINPCLVANYDGFHEVWISFGLFKKIIGGRNAGPLLVCWHQFRNKFGDTRFLPKFSVKMLWTDPKL